MGQVLCIELTDVEMADAAVPGLGSALLGQLAEHGGEQLTLGALLLRLDSLAAKAVADVAVSALKQRGRSFREAKKVVDSPDTAQVKLARDRIIRSQTVIDVRAAKVQAAHETIKENARLVDVASRLASLSRNKTNLMIGTKVAFVGMRVRVLPLGKIDEEEPPKFVPSMRQFCGAITKVSGFSFSGLHVHLEVSGKRYRFLPDWLEVADSED